MKKEVINDYICRGDCYVAYINDNTVGVFVSVKTGPLTLELANIAVLERFLFCLSSAGSPILS
ncbi:hypothetical protein [Clostridium sp. AWRP]|uniref:hypothetical protein n=1 Tax=Clostridium sp. AWRP TaxID=2212991 RepID=UPI000FDBD636|nr:hypothetical protein [Clostridium sp. AWRP]AZV57639.1 hypothetical protein DMR38_13975 [Clostridium sp. AWRP]